VTNYIPDGLTVTLESENSMPEIGPFPYEVDEDADPINSSKQKISELPQLVYFFSSESFAMIRRGHIDRIGSDGGLENGDITNWTILGKMIKGMGGTVDLVAGVKKIMVVMKHTSKNGDPKFIP
jgi:3-oxoacid CoA-transferase B subunit